MQTHNADSQAAMTHETALQALLDGNARFVRGEREARDYGQQISATAGGQWPFAVVLGCIDSRAPVEILFDQGIGDVFSARVAGNASNPELLGSMEFACKVAGAKLVLVLGHTSCGAIKGACDGVELGNLTSTLAPLMPAVDAVAGGFDADSRNSGNADFVQAAAEENVRKTMAAIRSDSPLLGEMEAAGEIAIVGAMYDVGSGQVSPIS